MRMSRKVLTSLALVAAATLAGAPCEGLVLCVSSSGRLALVLHSERADCSRELPGSHCENRELWHGRGEPEPGSCPPCVDIPVPRAADDPGLTASSASPGPPDHAAPALVRAAVPPPALDVSTMALWARPPPETSSVLSSLRTVVLLA